MHLQKSTSYPSPHVNPRPVGRAYSVNVDRGPLGHLSTKFDRYDVRLHSSGRLNDALPRRAGGTDVPRITAPLRHSWMSLAACQSTPAIDAAFYYLIGTSYQLQPSFHT